ncbi:hypothetical protein KJ780_05025, partial [Candidatus Micrarchaeota archaeon]|nr:hypothetical protein [Candidatus Micrarchaeota archaeon]
MNYSKLFEMLGLRNAIDFIKNHAIFLFLLFIIAFSPYLFQDLNCSPLEHDEGHYLLVTSRMLAGDTVYKDIYDNKLPLLY